MTRITLLAFLCIAAASCTKKPECWSCNYRTEEVGYEAVNTRIEYCDKTEAEIRDMENKAMTYTGIKSTFLICTKEAD